MDNKVLVGWGVKAIARGLAWVGAAWLGMEAAAAQSQSLAAAEALGALALVVISVITSLKGRKTLVDLPRGQTKKR